MYPPTFDPSDGPYMQSPASESSLYGPLSPLQHTPHHQGNLSIGSINVDPDPDQWLQHGGFHPYGYSQPYAQLDPLPFFGSYHQIDQPSGSVLGPPFSPNNLTFNAQQEIEDSEYSSLFPRQSSVPVIRVVTDVSSPTDQFSPLGMGVSPCSSGSSIASHPSTPMFPHVSYYIPSPVSDITSPITPDYTSNPPHYSTQVTPSIQDIVASFAPAGQGPFIPQKPYRPHTLSDRKRYVEEVELEEPIVFIMKDPDECGIPLNDALTGKYMRLKGRDDAMFVQRGPSVSIRLKWPGYGNWSRQIPTKDFRSPPGPITRAKLAKNIARTVERFIKEKQGKQHLDPDDEQWRVGPGSIGVNDLILVGLQHVSKGSWQAHLRLARPRTKVHFPTS